MEIMNEKNEIALRVEIPSELKKELKMYSAKIDQKIKYVVQNAIREFLNTYNN